MELKEIKSAKPGKLYSKSELANMYGVSVRTFMRVFYRFISADLLKTAKYQPTDKLITPLLVNELFSKTGNPNN